MKNIFKNKIGRPSNKLKRARRILIAIPIILIVILIIIGYANKNTIVNLFSNKIDKAMLSYSKSNSYTFIDIDYNCDSTTGNSKCSYFKYKVTTNNNNHVIKYRLGNNKLVTSSVKNAYESISNVDIQRDRYFSVYIYENNRVINSKTVTLKQNGFKGKTFYYDQTNYSQKYCGRTYGTIASAGCGGTSIAIALSNLTQSNKYDPVYVSDYAATFPSDENCRIDGTTEVGMKNIINGLIKKELTSELGYTLKLKRMTNESWDHEYAHVDKIKTEIIKALYNGGQVIVNATKGCFTGGQHFMAIVGISDDYKKIYLYDPNDGDEDYTEQSYCKFNSLKNGWYNINDFFSENGIDASGVFTAYIITKEEPAITLNCNKTSAKLNESIVCTTNQAGVTIRTSHEDNLVDNIHPLFVTTTNDKTKTLSYKKSGVVSIKATKNGKSVVKKVKVGNVSTTTTKKSFFSSNLKSFSLTCPTSAKINEEFTCRADTSGVQISLGGTKSLASGYSSKFKTNIFDKTKSIKYTSTLFTNYKSQIQTDTKGEYIYAYVYASKAGYKNVTKKVKIYNTSKSSNNNSQNNLKDIPVTCPTSATVNQEFKCSTNMSGVTIALGGYNSLASGYSSKFTTTSYDMTKNAKYTSALFTNYKSEIKKDSNGEYIYAYVYASKSGYKQTIKKVKIYRNASQSSQNNSSTLSLSCPTNILVNQEFKCTTNMSGVEIALGGYDALASGYSSKFTTTSNDMSKSAKYTSTLFTTFKSQIKKDSTGEYIEVNVYAYKTGYKQVVKKVKVYKTGSGGAAVNSTIGGAAATINKHNLYGISYDITINGKNKNKEFIINPTFYGSKVKKQTFVVCESNSCERNDAWDYMKKTYGSGAVTNKKSAKVGNKETLKLKTTYNGIVNRTFYVRATTYDSNGNILMVLVTKYDIDSNAKMTPSVTLNKFYK